MRRLVWIGVLGVTGCLVLSGCGSDDQKGSAASDGFCPVTVVSNQADLDALVASQCRSIGGLTIDADDVETLDGLETLAHASDVVKLSGASLRSIEGLANLETVSEGVSIYDAPKLESLRGLDELAYAPGSFSIARTGIKSLDGLGALHARLLVILDNDALESVSGLGENFWDVGAYLHVAGAPALKSLVGLDAVARVEGLTFERTGLKTLGPLHDWASGTVVSGIDFVGNAALPQCEIDRFAEKQGLKGGCAVCEGNSDVACE